MTVRLNVPYAEKDSAKEKGAKWNPTAKTWFIDDVTKLSGLLKWVNAYNVICEHLYIFKMSRICWKCSKEANVVCLGSDKSYSSESNYQMNANIQLFSYVQSMPDQLAKYMKEQFAYFPSYSKTVNSVYYINHCKYCSSIQGDNYLHELPIESFYKKLCYKDSNPTEYFKISTQFSVPLQATLPYYDEISSSFELAMLHMRTGIENRESLDITQKLMNNLFCVSVLQTSVDINGV